MRNRTQNASCSDEAPGLFYLHNGDHRRSRAMNGTTPPSNTTPSSRSSSSGDGLLERVYSEQEQQRQIVTRNHTRERLGLCMTCGRHLYRNAQTTLNFPRRKENKEQVRIPLSIPGNVERGQCLECGTTSTSTTTDDSNKHNHCVSPDVCSNRSDDIGMRRVRVRRSSCSSSRNHQPTTRRPSNSQSSGSSIAIYEGSFNVYGERNGQGTMTWENGDKYNGDFFNGNRHGHGTLVFADGSEYVGQWECNRQHGIGTRRWNNGDCYTGQYQNGKRTGEGRFYYSNGDMYNGQWHDGTMQGHGRYYYASGQRFEGTFAQGKRTGKGRSQRKDGSLEVGVYTNDVRMGVGVRWSADRTQAWRLWDGKVKKKITIPAAVALDYDIDAYAAIKAVNPVV